MKKLTKKERKEIYLKAAKYFHEDDAILGLCSFLSEKSDGANYNDLGKIFPEFRSHYPNGENNGLYWYINNSERVIIACMMAAMCN